MIFHLVMLHTTPYYICILYTVYYILLPVYVHIATLYVYGFLIFPVDARLVYVQLTDRSFYETRMTHHSYNTCCTSMDDI